MPKKKILFLFNKFPYPPIGGDKVKMYNLAKILSRDFSVDLICINEGGLGVNRYYEPPFHNITCFNYPSIRFRINALLGVCSRLPLQTHYYHFSEVQKYIDSTIANYDFVFCNLVRMAGYVMDKKIPKVIDMADSIALAYKRFCRYASGIWKLLYYIDSERLINYELEIIRHFNKTLLVNEKEKAILVSLGAEADKIAVLTNGVDTRLFSYEETAKGNKEIIFFGRLAAFHNRDAVIYFAREVFPLIRKKRMDIRFVVIGADAPPEILRLKGCDGIEICGYMEDPYKRISNAMLCVFPMRMASGVQNKLLEAMALRKAIVATPIAVEAINGEDGEHFILAADKISMAARILRLLENEGAREELGTNARRLIETKYTWACYEKGLLDVLKDIR